MSIVFVYTQLNVKKQSYFKQFSSAYKKMFHFKQLSLAWARCLNVKTILFQAIQFSIIAQFSSI